MTALDFPAIRGRAVTFHPQNVSRSGGQSTNGLEQVIESGAGRWRASVSVHIATPERVRLWRAFLSAMHGRAGTVLVPVFDHAQVNWPVDAYGRVLTPDFTRRKGLDDTVYEDPEIPSESAIVATAGAAAIRAQQIAITVTQGGTLQAGQYFSIAGKLYLIDSILSVAGSVSTVSFWPSLRAAVSVGAAVELRWPVCEMRFATDDDGEMPLSATQFPIVSPNFVEAY